MVWPGPSSLARRIAPATLMPVEQPRHRPSLEQQVEDDRQRLLVGDLIGEVDRRVFEILGDAALADAFGDRAAFGLELAVLVVMVERGAHRIGQRDLDVLVGPLSAMATPASVPPVPTAQTKPSTLPSVWRQISGPVVSIWPSRLATLSNWLAQIAPAGSVLGQRLGQAARRTSRSCWDRGRAPPALRAARRRTGAACPSFPGSGSRG